MQGELFDHLDRNEGLQEPMGLAAACRLVGMTPARVKELLRTETEAPTHQAVPEHVVSKVMEAWNEHHSIRACALAAGVSQARARRVLREQMGDEDDD